MTYELMDGIPVWGGADDATLAQIKMCKETGDAAAAALMADNHKGYSCPIGGVVAYHEAISPSGVGFDIACGNKAVLLDIPAKDVRARIKPIMDMIWEHLSFGMGRRNKTEVDHPLFDSDAWFLPPMNALKDKAREQLGTIGSGNHYVDLMEDELGRCWIGVHFGSRGLGHKTATHFLKEGGAKDGMDVPPLVLSVNTALGHDYLRCMELAGEYAYAGRDWVCDEVARLLGAKILDFCHNHHNFAWKEVHNGVELYVVRKGATPAFPGQRGFVGGSMGEPAVILEGVDSEESKVAMYSTVHGAGRVMSRTQAKGKTHRKTGEHTPGMITKHQMRDWLRRESVELRGGDVDESPHAYKRLDEVLGFHADTVKIIHTLMPFGVAMAGEDVYDPYKD